MRAPVGLVEIQALYGDPQQFVRDDGTASPFWEMRMVKVPLPGPLPLGWNPSVTVTSARVNQAIASEVEALFKAFVDAKAWDFIHTFDGGYAWRPQRGSTSKMSMHAYEGAIDFNAATNQLGTKGDMHPMVVQVALGLGWTWGGGWQRPDPMHLQFGSGY